MVISDELKIYELSLIWREAEYNFAFWNKFDNNLNWDEEYKKALTNVLKTTNLYDYYLELMRFVALLKDGHTDVWFPKEIYESQEYCSKLPIGITYIDNKYVVTNLKKSIKDKVKRYSIIKKINNVDINEYIEKNIYPYIWHEKQDSCSNRVEWFLRNGSINSSIDMTLEYNSQEYSVTLVRDKGTYEWIYQQESFKTEEMIDKYESESHKIQFTKDDIAIVTIDTMTNDNLPKEIYQNYELLKKAKGYIFDIRNNGGGNSRNANAVASLFIGNKFKTDNTYHPIHIGVYKAWGIYEGYDQITEKEFLKKKHSNFDDKTFRIVKHIYYEHDENIQEFSGVEKKLDGPIVILTSEHTASAAENFINVMKYYTNALIVGTASFGSTGQPLTINLESGGGFRICTRMSKSLDNSEFINIGYTPHIECKLTIDDYIKKVDAVMNRGLEVLRNKLKK